MFSTWKILDYFFLLRPTLFFPLLTVILAGRYNSGSESSIVQLFIYFAALMGASYAINQIVDKEGDEKNNKLFLIAGDYIKSSHAMIYSGVLIVFGIAGLLHLGISFGLLGVAFFIMTAVLYNMSPWNWKDKPILGIVVTVSGGGMAFIFGCLPEFNLILIAKSFAYIAAFGAVAVLTAVPDMDGDKVTGKNTFALRYGPGAAAITATILCILSALLGWWTGDRLIFWPALISTPVFIYSNFDRSKKSILFTIKFAILLVSLAVGLRYFWYLALIAVYYFFARWYYAKRFNIVYPSINAQ